MNEGGFTRSAYTNRRKGRIRLPYIRLSVQTLALVVLALALPHIGRAATFPVNSTADVTDLDAGDGVCNTGNVTSGGEPECTLRAALQQSNNLTGDDVINLPAGTYQLTLDGELEILDGLSLRGEAADTTIIERKAVITRTRESRFQELGGDEVLTVFRSANCEGSCDGVLSVGSRELGLRAVANISDVTIRNGFSGSGGGLFIDEGSSVFLTGSVVRDNFVQSSGGGGIFSFSGFLELSRSTVTNNMVIADPAGGGATTSGGGILGGTETVIVESTISNNQANRGGGIAIFGAGKLGIKKSTISGNNANVRGGGIYNTGTANISFSTITGNRAAVGLLLRPSFIGDPEDREFRVGGGIANSDSVSGPGTISMHHTILANNSQIGDVRYETPLGAPVQIGTFSKLSFDERITDEPFSPDCFSQSPNTFTSSGNNLIGIADFDFVNQFGRRIVSQNCNFAGVAGDLVGPQLPIDPAEGPKPIDPQLGPLVNNGGPTPTHALLAGSPAIDAGDNTVCPNTDQREFLRPADGNGDTVAICDIGAFEVNAKPPVTEPPPATCDDRGTTMGCTVNGAPYQLCQGASGNDTIIGTDGPDVISGLGGRDIIRGLRGGDRICGGRARDRLSGERGNDRLFGQLHRDLVFGGRDNDALDGGARRDFCNGGIGRNTAVRCERVVNVP